MDADKVEHAIKMRLAADRVSAEVRATDDPEAIQKMERATTAWLDVWDELSAAEAKSFNDGYNARKLNA